MKRSEFAAAFAAKLEFFWGPLGEEAKKWCWDYLDGVKFGDPAFDWSKDAAEELATEYAKEFAECHHEGNRPSQAFLE